VFEATASAQGSLSVTITSMIGISLSVPCDDRRATQGGRLRSKSTISNWEYHVNHLYENCLAPLGANRSRNFIHFLVTHMHSSLE
jgi:hypothetical protein